MAFRRTKNWRRHVLFVLSAWMIASNPVSVFAANTDPLFCEHNVIIIGCTNPTECSTSASSSTGTGNPDGTSTDGLTDEQAAFVDKYHDIAERLSIQYGIPWETVMAQGILESNAGTSNFAVQRNNFFGIGAFDSNPNNAHSFATPEEGWEGYYKNIANTPTYRNHGVFQGSTVTDPYEYLKAIKAAGYATDPLYVSKVSKFIDAVDKRAKQKGWKSSADLAKDHPEMLTNAEKYAGGSGAGASANGSSGGDSASCASGSAPSGSIAEVAKQMGTWGAQYQSCYVYGGGHGKTTEWIQEAIKNHFAGDYAVDCSAFVRAVVLQATGKDVGDSTTQTFCADSKNWEHIPRDQAQPGDLAIDCANHVEVITGVSDGKFSTVGSHTTGCGPGKGASPGNYQGSESFVLRYKG